MKTAVLALVVVTLATAACGNGSQNVTAPSTSSTNTFETFSGSVGPQGSSFYSFTVTTAGTVSVSLSSLMANTIGPASTAVVRVGLGVPLGTGCNVTSSVDTAAGLTTQLTVPVNPDVYCVNIADIGNLTDSMNFTIRIGQNLTPSSSTATPATETFASLLYTGGIAARTFSALQAGTVTLTLTSVTPSTIVVGLGIGIRGPGGGGPACLLSNSVDATAGSAPQLTVAVDADNYCVQVYDSGHVNSSGVAFSVTINHP
jgi:hypothetical protein